MKQWIVIFVIALLFLFCSIPCVSAQDQESTLVSERPNTGIEFTIGIGESYNSLTSGFPVISFDVEFLYNINSIWRIGLTEKVGIDKNWVHRDNFNFATTTLLMNELVAYHTDSFEFTPRLGVGFKVIAGQEERDVTSGNFTSVMFAVNTGIGLGWRVTPNIMLGLNIDYVFGVNVSETEDLDYINSTVHGIDAIFASTFKF